MFTTMYKVRAISYIAISNNMTQREILLEMFEKLWNADKDKFTLECNTEGHTCKIRNL